MVEYVRNKFAHGILNGTVRNKRYVVKDGLILKRNRIFLTPKFETKGKVLHALYNTLLTSYPRITKIYQSVRGRFTWKGLKQDILSYVQECVQYQENKERAF